MRVFYVINLIWIQIALAQINSPLPNGCGFRQNLPPSNLPVNQLPLNNGVPLSNAINPPPVRNIPFNQVQNLPFNSLPNGNLPFNNLPNANLALNNGLPNLPVTNRLTLPQQALPVNYGNLPQSLSPIQNNYGNLPNNLPVSNLPFNNLPLNNLPINNVPVNNLPIGNLPVGNNYQISNLPVFNNLPVNNFQSANNLNSLLNNYVSSIPQNRVNAPNLQLANNLPNNIQFINSLPANNIQPNNLQIPLTNNAQLLNNVLINNLPQGNNLIQANYLQNKNIANTLPSVNYNLPNNLATVNYNLPLPNANYLNNNLQSSNAFNNIQLALPINNANNLYTGQIGNVANYIPNNIVGNVGQNLPISLSQPINSLYLNANQNVAQSSIGSQYMPAIQNVPTNVNFGNDCGCKANALFLLDDKVANSLPSTPILSLNGLQLGGLGKLPLFNGLPVIGMTESIINLNSL